MAMNIISPSLCVVYVCVCVCVCGSFLHHAALSPLGDPVQLTEC